MSRRFRPNPAVRREKINAWHHGHQPVSGPRINTPQGSRPRSPGANLDQERAQAWAKNVRQRLPSNEPLDASTQPTEDEDDDDTRSPRTESGPRSAIRKDPRSHTPSRQPSGEAWTSRSFRRRPRARELGRHSALGRSHNYRARFQHRQSGVPLKVRRIPNTTDEPSALRRDTRDYADQGAGSRHPNVARLRDSRATLVRLGRTRLQLANARQRHAQRRVHRRGEGANAERARNQTTPHPGEGSSTPRLSKTNGNAHAPRTGSHSLEEDRTETPRCDARDPRRQRTLDDDRRNDTHRAVQAPVERRHRSPSGTVGRRPAGREAVPALHGVNERTWRHRRIPRSAANRHLFPAI